MNRVRIPVKLCTYLMAWLCILAHNINVLCGRGQLVQTLCVVLPSTHVRTSFPARLVCQRSLGEIT